MADRERQLGELESAEARTVALSERPLVAEPAGLGAPSFAPVAAGAAAGFVATPAQLPPAAGRIDVPIRTTRPRGAATPRRRGWLAKCVIDRVGAAVALLALSPVLAAIALAVKLSSRGPVFHRQTRIGLHGRAFTFLKFRTMVRDAEARRDELAHRNEASGLLFKIRDDPRVTPVGRLLRRLSLDELPQLWHVLTGRMSLVGPRPPLPDEVASYDAVVAQRLHVKPGLTGLWQVSGRSDLPWDEAVRLDLHYVHSWTVLMDLRILARTIPAVLAGRGAY